MKEKLWILLMAAACGAFVGTGLNKELTTPRQRLMFWLSGLFCAFWLVTPLCHKFNVVDQDMINGITFVFAAFWPKVLARISIAIDNFKLMGGSSK